MYKVNTPKLYDKSVGDKKMTEKEWVLFLSIGLLSFVIFGVGIGIKGMWTLFEMKCFSVGAIPKDKIKK